MRSDDDPTERVGRLLAAAPDPGSDPGRVPPQPWPQSWPPGADDPPERFAAPRWEVSPRAAVAVVVVALLVVALAVVLLRPSAAPETVAPGRDPGLRPGFAGATPSGSVAGGPAVPLPSSSAASSAGWSTDPSAGSAGLRVYVVGQVRRPGVVSLAGGARVEDAVQAAGGAGAKADLGRINLARRVVDGELIRVPRPGEELPEPGLATSADSAPDGAGPGAAGGVAGTAGTPVDLNTATLAELDALPGVGPVIAGRIVAWRQQNGRFTRVDDLAEVQGIGDATLARLRPLVRV